MITLLTIGKIQSAFAAALIKEMLGQSISAHIILVLDAASFRAIHAVSQGAKFGFPRFLWINIPRAWGSWVQIEHAGSMRKRANCPQVSMGTGSWIKRSASIRLQAVWWEKSLLQELAILQELFFLTTVWRAISPKPCGCEYLGQKYCDFLLMRESTVHLGSFKSNDQLLV